MAPEERFWSHVDRSGEHWLWTGATASGYGHYRWQGRMRGAHVIAFLLSGGSLDHGQQVLHQCDVKTCVRPEHLFAGTQADNVHDMIAKGRQATGSALNHQPQNGERNHNAKLTDAQVEEMRRLFDSGQATQGELMRQFNTSRANVHVIVRRKSRA